MVISPTEAILTDGRDYAYLTPSCQLTIRTVTNVVGCDRNDGNMLIFHATSNPDSIALLCIQTHGYKIHCDNGKTSPTYHCVGGWT